MSSLDTEKLFQRLLRDLKPIFALQGFVKRGQNFCLQSAESWGIINFQKSRWSDEGAKTFTVNAAVAVKRILTFYGEQIDKPPVYYAAHWNERIGSLLPAYKDVWWMLSGEESYPPVLQAVSDAIEQFAIPAVRRLMSEDSLLEHWRGERGGLEYLRLKHQSILLAERGQLTELGSIMFRILEIT